MLMKKADGFMVSAGRDPRGMQVQGNDLHVVGTISDLWVDVRGRLARAAGNAR